MNIIFFSDHFKPEPSAPAAHVYERARIWCEMGHDVTVICAAPNFPEGKVYEGYRNRWRSIERLDGIRVVRVKTLIAPNDGCLVRILDYLSYALSAFSMALFEKKPDIVVSTSPHFFVPVAASMYAGLKGVPHVLEVRDLWPESISAVNAMKQKGFVYRMLERLELFLYRHAARIITLTNSFRDDLVSRGIDPTKIHVVVGGANLDLFSPRPKDSDIQRELCLEDKFVVGYLGTIGMAHALENVLSAAELLRDENMIFLFVGEGAAKEDLEKRARLKRIDNVQFISRKRREEMPAYLSVCDLSLIHLRDHETFAKVIPSKIFEAMAMHVPILFVGPEGEGSAIIKTNAVGAYVKPGVPEALAAVIRELMKDGALRESYARNCREISKSYSREYQSARTMAVLCAAAEG